MPMFESLGFANMRPDLSLGTILRADISQQVGQILPPATSGGRLRSGMLRFLTVPKTNVAVLGNSLLTLHPPVLWATVLCLGCWSLWWLIRLDARTLPDAGLEGPSKWSHPSFSSCALTGWVIQRTSRVLAHYWCFHILLSFQLRDS